MVAYQVTNPATGKVGSEYPTATDAEISDILTRADAGYKSWRRTSLDERAAILNRVSELYRDRADDLASIITREMGKITKAALGEIKFASAIYKYYADNGAELLKDQPLDTRVPGSAWVRKSPVGALLGIMPWNYPYYQVARFAAPNLMIGNTIILKHAPQCPESALAMQQIFHDAGLPADAYINVFASNEQVAEIIADPRIAGGSVTGSERAGAAVAATAGQHLKKVVLELGGSDPFIVLDGANLPEVAKTAAAARMENGGQACNSPRRMIGAESVYDEFMSEFTAAMSGYTTGDPPDPATSYGPMSSEQAAVNLTAQIDDAVSKGATVHLGGPRVDGPGSFFEPTVLSGVTPEMRAFREELFGPAAVVYKVADAAEAVELANRSALGLGGAVSSSDEARAVDVADRLDWGMAWVTSAEGGGADLPFGGTKRSGNGRELGPLGIDEFVNKKLMHTPPEGS